MSQLPVAEPYLEPERRTWPLVLGILAAIWGGIGSASAGLALAGVGQDAQPEVMRHGLGASLSAVSGLLAAGLLAGGVQLIRRRVSGVLLLRTWIPLSVLAQVGVLSLMLTHRDDFERAMRESMEREAEARAAKGGAAPPQLPQGFEKVMFSIGLGCGGVAAIVPPAIAAFFVFGGRGRQAVAEWSLAGS